MPVNSSMDNESVSLSALTSSAEVSTRPSTTSVDGACGRPVSDSSRVLVAPGSSCDIRQRTRVAVGCVQPGLVCCTGAEKSMITSTLREFDGPRLTTATFSGSSIGPAGSNGLRGAVSSIAMSERTRIASLAIAERSASTRISSDPPAGMAALKSGASTPLAGQLAPAAAVQVQVTLLRSCGSVSAMSTEGASLGPLLITSIRQDTGRPATTSALSVVLVTDTSATAITSVSTLSSWSPGVGSVASGSGVSSTALVIRPMKPGSITAFSTMSSWPSGSTSALNNGAPVPAAGQLEPSLAAQLHSICSSAAGAISVITIPSALLGPVLVTVIW